MSSHFWRKSSKIDDFRPGCMGSFFDLKGRKTSIFEGSENRPKRGDFPTSLPSAISAEIADGRQVILAVGGLRFGGIPLGNGGRFPIFGSSFFGPKGVKKLSL